MLSQIGRKRKSRRKKTAAAVEKNAAAVYNESNRSRGKLWGSGMPLPATHLQPVQAIVKMALGPRFVIARRPRPTWRPEREARGSALGVQSREGSAVSYRLPLKWHAPIASVAALTAQPLAALPPYGCGVPLAGSERLGGWQYLRYVFYGVRSPGLSFRGAKRRGNLAEPG